MCQVKYFFLTSIKAFYAYFQVHMAVVAEWRAENRPKRPPLLLLEEARPSFCEQLQEITEDLEIPQNDLRARQSIKTHLFLPIHIRKALMTRKAMAPAVKPYAASGDCESRTRTP